MEAPPERAYSKRDGAARSSLVRRAARWTHEGATTRKG